MGKFFAGGDGLWSFVWWEKAADCGPREALEANRLMVSSFICRRLPRNFARRPLT